MVRKMLPEEKESVSDLSQQVDRQRLASAQIIKKSGGLAQRK
jgi:ABC-type Mn2+/Zn2+ transport system ATPase subunit